MEAKCIVQWREPKGIMMIDMDVRKSSLRRRDTYVSLLSAMHRHFLYVH